MRSWFTLDPTHVRDITLIGLKNNIQAMAECPAELFQVWCINVPALCEEDMDGHQLQMRVVKETPDGSPNLITIPS